MSVCLDLITSVDANAVMDRLIQPDFILDCALGEAESSDDLRFTMITKRFADRRTREEELRFVYTLLESEYITEMIDVDMVLPHEETVILKFVKRLPSKDSENEFYLVEAVESKAEFELFTVNHHLVDEGLLGQTRDVRLNAFPYDFSVFDSLTALYNSSVADKNSRARKKANSESKKANSDSDGLIVARGEYLARIMGHKDVFATILIAKVLAYRVVEVDLRGIMVRFGRVDLQTSVGVVAMAVNLEKEDAAKLKPGKYVMASVAMVADVCWLLDF